MPIPHNENQLGQPFRNKKKRGAVFIVVVASIVVHALGLGALGVMKIVETVAAPPEFEAPPVVANKPPPLPPTKAPSNREKPGRFAWSIAAMTPLSSKSTEKLF